MSGMNVYCALQERFPRVKVTTQLENNCPQFLNMLTRICENFHTTGISKETEIKVEAARQKTEAARRSYLKSLVRYETLTELITGVDIASLTTPGLRHEERLVNKLKDNLSLAEVSCMINLGDINGDPVTTLGLDQHNTKLKGFNSSDDFGQQCLPLLEDVLYEKCFPLLRLLEHDLDTSLPRSVLHSHIQRLGDKVADLISDIQMNQQQEIDECRMEKKKIYNQHLALLGQIVDILETLITKYYCGSIASSNATVVRNLSVEVECLLSYTQTKALEIEVQTYTGDSVLAVRKVKNKLTSKIKDFDQENIDLRSRLEQYEKCGPELTDIVAEFSKVQKETEVRKWALEELSQNKC